MFVLGITGGIGCGKSTAAGILALHGLKVCDADAISHEVTEAGGAAIPEIIEVFGPDFIGEDKSLNRKKMGDLVFQDKTLLDKLSFIIHKHVIHEMGKRIEKAKKAKEKVIVLDVPIPVREGFLDVSDQVWVIWTEDSIRLKRLQERGMDETEARRRMSIQMSEEEYTQIADEKIYNNGSVQELEQSLIMLMERELISRGIPVDLTSKIGESDREVETSLNIETE